MSIDEKINEALGISNDKPVTKAVVKKEYTPPVPRVEDKNKEDVDNDYKYSRENYYNLIERGQDAIQGILDIANESQHPRAYEVAGNLIKQVADTVDKLQDLQGKLKTLKDVPNKTSTNIKQALVVPGSGLVKKQAEKEGLDKIFIEAGFEWRDPGCSMCLAMNADRLEPQERCASTSNRNFEGRQGQGGRTHLVSPEMAAAAAVNGKFVDIREMP